MTKYRVGSIVRGFVTGIEKYGAFVSLPDYYNGMIHISEISDGFVRNISDYFHIGDVIYVKVLEVDEKLNQVRLSIKDIDYKVDGKRIKKVKEVGEGFKPLEEHLDEWINEKLKEFEKN